LRRVAYPDLTHLDTDLELGRQVTHQIAEVDALFGREETGDLGPTVADLGTDDLHRKVVGSCDACADQEGTLLALTTFRFAPLVTVMSTADHPDGRRHARQLPARSDGDGRHLHGTIHVTHHELARAQDHVPGVGLDHTATLEELEHHGV